MNLHRSLPWMIAIAALAGALGLFLGQRWFAPADATPTTRSAIVYPQPRVLGDFELERTSDGGTLTLADWRGQWSLVFIGFTHCPDACPQTLALYRDLEQKWPDSAGTLPALYFVSVDPERDTAQALNEYSHYFSSTIIPVRGEHAQLEPFTRQLGMIYVSEPLSDGDYTVDHSTHLALVDPQARLVALFRAPLSVDAIIEDLQRLGATTSSTSG